MLYNKVIKAIKYVGGNNVYEIAEKNDIDIKPIPLETAYGVILMGSTTTIYIDNDLPWQRKEFVLWHEIAHFLMDGKGEYEFSKNGRSELKANLFACLMVGDNTNEWIKNGCPTNIAHNVYDYISQNVYVQETLSDVYY